MRYSSGIILHFGLHHHHDKRDFSTLEIGKDPISPPLTVYCCTHTKIVPNDLDEFSARESSAKRLAVYSFTAGYTLFFIVYS